MLSIIVALLIGLALIGRKEIPLKLFSTYNDLEQVELDPQSLKKDEVLKRYLDNLNKLFFSQVQPKAVKIWVGTNNNKNLVNIYTSSNWDQSINDDKDAKSIIGGTAKNKIFVLWPGYKREFDNNVAWDANGPIKAKYNCETRIMSPL